MIKIPFGTEKQSKQSTGPLSVLCHGAVLDDLWDDFLDHAPCQAQGILIEEVKADLIKQGLLHP